MSYLRYMDMVAPLADVQVTTDESDEGLVYDYWIDLEPLAEGELTADLIAQSGLLEYELHANFFDDIQQVFLS